MMRVPHVTHVQEDITPVIAEQYLQRNLQNRPIRTRRVKELAGDMEAGRWEENGEAGITFDWNNHIAGGQHTLSAIVMSGVTVRLRVTRGVRPQARSTMNDSSKQRFSDDLHVTGIGNSQRAEALLRKILVWEKVAGASPKHLGGLVHWSTTRFTRAELAEAWPKYAGGITDTLKMCQQWAEAWGIVGNAGALEFTCWLLTVRHDNNHASVISYFDRLAFGSQDEGDQILTRVKLRLRRKPNTAPYQVFWLIRGWNAWTRGEKLAKLQISPGGLPENYPAPQKTR